jgi:ketosteroid isomerase-like protein
MNENAQAPEEQDPEILEGVFEAVARRSWAQIDALTDPHIELTISAHADVQASPNEDIWRSVHVQGTEALQAYMGQLYEALPSFTLVARRRGKDGRCAGVDAEFSGVNNGGVPFDAFAEMQVCVVDGKVRRVTAVVQQVSYGQGLITNPNQDPRRYFQGFLDSATGGRDHSAD